MLQKTFEEAQTLVKKLQQEKAGYEESHHKLSDEAREQTEKRLEATNEKVKTLENVLKDKEEMVTHTQKDMQ